MPVDNDQLAPLVDDFYAAFRSKEGRPGPSIDIGKLTLSEAYEVQRRVIERRVADGEKPVGYKVGCTSRAIRSQFGLTEPVMGRLMFPDVFTDGVRLSLRQFFSCAVEPEFVFRIGADVTGDFLATRELATAIESVSAGIELHNYRFRYGKATSQELISSNAIHAGVVIGTRQIKPQDLDFELEGAGIFLDGALVTSGIGAEIMGGPLISLRWLATKLLSQGGMLRKGDIVIPGSPVGLVPVTKPAKAAARLTRCGSVSAEFY